MSNSNTSLNYLKERLKNSNKDLLKEFGESLTDQPLDGETKILKIGKKVDPKGNVFIGKTFEFKNQSKKEQGMFL